MPISTLKLFSFTRSSTNHKPSNRSDPNLLLAPNSHRPTSDPSHLDSTATREKEIVEAGHLFLMGHSPSPPSKPHRITRSTRSPNSSQSRSVRPRSTSRRRYSVPEIPADNIDGCPYCPEQKGKQFGIDQETAWAVKGEVRKEEQDETRRGSNSSLDSLQGLSGSRRPSAVNRPPLFDDVDGFEVDQLSLSSTSSSEEEDDDDGAESLFSYNSPPTSAYSLGRSPSLRKSSLSTTATSDPLISPSSVPSVPVLSYGCPAHQRGHWLPATPNKVPAPSAQSQVAPSLPDAPPPSSSPVSLSTSPEKQASSLRRASSLTSFSPSRPSLLSKSLRSLASLPNLTLPNLLPQLPRPDIYLSSNSEYQTPFLKSGWGAKERRRVLDSEPSWDADEARGLLSRRSRRALNLVDEVEATLFASANGISPDADLALSDFSTPVPVPSPPPSPTLADSPPLISTPPPPPLPPPSSPPPPSQRFISNTRHLLMLSIEFSMMRADKISSPLRPRAVIVRNGSPTRGGVTSLGPSGLRNEVV